MKRWKAYIEIWNIDISYFRTIEFDVPDDLYEKMTDVLSKGILLRDSDIYKELWECFDINERDFIDENDLPYRDDYDTEEEFLEEYNEALENAIMDITIANIDIYDPNELNNFKKHFIGKRYPNCETGSKYGDRLELWEPSDSRNVKYTLEVYFSEDGTITDIDLLSSEGCEWEGIKNSSYAECYPNYELLTEELEKRLNKEL